MLKIYSNIVHVFWYCVYKVNIIFNNIPYCLALILVRIYSTEQILKQRLEELSAMLLSRNYNKNIVKAALQKASTLNRLETLKNVVRSQTNRVILGIRYHPCLTSVSTVVNTHWKTMTLDPTLKKVFPEPPMLAFKQPLNLRSMLVRAKLSTKSRPSRVNIGTHKCGKQCKLCSYINTDKEIKSNVTKEVVKYKSDFSCTTVGVIYLITCTKCNIQYIGQTTRRFNTGIKEHITAIKKCEDTVIGTHFNTVWHSLDNFSAQVIEKVCPTEMHTLLEREKIWILRFNTILPLGHNHHVWMHFIV